MSRVALLEFTRFLILTVAMMPMTPSQPVPFYDDKLNLLQYLDENGRTHPIATPEEWQIRRRHILSNMELVMGELPTAPRDVPPPVNATEEFETARFLRQRITFEVAKGDRVPAYLFLPKGALGKRPAMLCLHQTTQIGKGEPAGVGGNGDLHYALELAERGFVTLAPDYPGFGDYRIDVYARGYASATMAGIWNHMRAVDLLSSLPQVDAERIGVIGHSLGGHNSLFLAAFDERVKAVVTSCGFNAFPKYYAGNLAGWSHNGYMPRIASVYGCDPAKMPFDFTEVLAAIAPRAVFVNAPLGDENFEVSGVYDCLNAARPVYRLFGAEDRLQAVHPDCGHSFPADVRQQAYEFLDKLLAR